MPRRTEKTYVKVIDDDIYNRIIEFIAKKEIIKMNRNTVMLTKKYGELNHKHYACEGNNAGYLNVEAFHKKPGVILS